MATLDASKSGRLTMINESSHANARDSTTAESTTVNPSSGTTSNAIMYVKSSGRSGSVYNIVRHFYYFDTSAITGDVSDASLNILGAQSETAQTIVVPSTAFGGDGSADIVAADYNNLTFNTSYGAGASGYSDNSNNSLTLRATAANFIRDNDYFICAVIEFEHDFADNDPGSTVSKKNGINYGTAAFLEYTEASSASGPANLTSFNGIAKASITSINGITMANITTLNGIS